MDVRLLLTQPATRSPNPIRPTTGERGYAQPVTKVRHNTPLLLLAAVALLFNRLLLACRLRKRRDGWRRATGLVLRGECSMFVLSAFALDPWPSRGEGERPVDATAEQTQSQIARRLHQFLTGETACHVRIINGPGESRPEPTATPSYTLAFQPWTDGPARFVMPTDWSPGPLSPPDAAQPGIGPLLNIVCRAGPRGECDLWFRINHVGADGVPMQEVLTRLESDWGTVYPVLFPTPEEFEPFTQPRPAPGCDGLAQVQFFADFAPLLAWRKRQNARLSEPMTVSAALLWQLGNLPEFKQFRLGTTVDVAADARTPRGVGVVVTRAGDDRLDRFVRRFNRDLDLNRRRASFGCGMLDASALMPASLAAPQLRFALTKVSMAFGAVGLTMLKDAKVFGTPIADAGHNRGFIAIGSLSLPCADGRPGGIGCVTVKGDPGTIGAYPRLFHAAMAACSAAGNTTA